MTSLQSQAELYTLQRKLTDFEIRLTKLQRERDDALSAKYDADSELARGFKLFEQQTEVHKHEREILTQEAETTNEKLKESRSYTVQLERELAQVTSDLESAQSELRSTHTSATATALSSAQIQNRQLSSENELLRQENVAHTATISALEAEVARLTRDEAAWPVDPSRNIAQDQQLSELMAHNRQLEDNLHSLSSRIETARIAEQLNTVLTEEKRTLRNKLESLYSLESENTSLKLKMADLERERNAWAVYLQGNDEITHPSQITQQVGLLQIENSNLKARLNSVSETLGLLKQTPVQQSLQRVSQELVSANEALENERSIKTRLEIQRRTQEKQISLLQEQLRFGAAADQRQYCEQLENTITELKSQLTEVTSKMAERDSQRVSSNRRESLLAVDQVVDLNEKLASSQQDLQEARTRLDHEQSINQTLQNQLEQAIGELKNLRPADGMQVLEVAGSTYDSTVRDRLQRLELLEKENHDLLAMMQNQNVEKVPLKSLAVLSQRIDTLQTELERKSKVEQRSLEAFRAKTFEHYVARLDILGYDLEIKPNRTCLARSSYTLDEELGFFEFVFDPIQRRYVDMSFTSSVQSYQNQYEYWVKQRNCLPGFLATVFLENFEKYGNPPPRSQTRV